MRRYTTFGAYFFYELLFINYKCGSVILSFLSIGKVNGEDYGQFRFFGL